MNRCKRIYKSNFVMLSFSTFFTRHFWTISWAIAQQVFWRKVCLGWGRQLFHLQLEFCHWKDVVLWEFCCGEDSGVFHIGEKKEKRQQKKAERITRQRRHSWVYFRICLAREPNRSINNHPSNRQERNISVK